MLQRPAREVGIEDEKLKEEHGRREQRQEKRRVREREREASLSGRCDASDACARVRACVRVRARDSVPEGILLISRGPLRKVICTIRK